MKLLNKLIKAFLTLFRRNEQNEKGSNNSLPIELKGKKKLNSRQKREYIERMRKLRALEKRAQKLMLIFLYLPPLLILSGCGSGQVVTQTQTTRMYPPEMLVQPIPEPEPPLVPETMTTGDLLDWWRDWKEAYRRAWKEAEADKAAIREWMTRGE
ncbi:MAG: hypothetical protein AVO39_10380 [delta proteobacterium MLS_D]|nr:MAG: hypothetical protein AVO39_10380 [delta proteobacterium MLS_D]